MSHDPFPEPPVPDFYIAGTLSLSQRSLRALKQDDTFALFDHYGDVPLGNVITPEGIYHQDTRYLSRLLLRIEGFRPLLLNSSLQSNNTLLNAGMTNPDLHRDGVLVMQKDTIYLSRAKFLWHATCYDLLTATNYGEIPHSVRLGFDFDSDFADLFEVRGHQRPHRGKVQVTVLGRDTVQSDYASLDGVPRSVQICFDPAPRELRVGRAIFTLDLQPGKSQAIMVIVRCLAGGAGQRGKFVPSLRAAHRAVMATKLRAASVETSNPLINDVLQRSAADISMLLTQTEQGPYPYAGVPWFSAPFGRDGIITAMQLLWLDPAIARTVLRFLAAHQANEYDDRSDAEPGKILHEMRQCELARLGEIPFGRYYGSIDSTPLFVALAGLYWQRTGDSDTLTALWPHIKAALRWIDSEGDRDGDGLIEYGRRRDTGLANQGWKDSADSVFHKDGRLAPLPIALIEVQGYVYLARMLASRMATFMGELRLASNLSEQARMIQEKVESCFWCEKLGFYALALDGEKKPCEVRTSNAGQLLFSGLPSPDHARRIATALLRADCFSGWGIRTLSAREQRFNPTSYHNGSVWPHDNSIIAMGLSQYGCKDHVVRMTAALFQAAAQMDLRRIPELFCGFHRKRDQSPTLYPVACTPQAWAAASPFAMLASCLGMSIDASTSTVELRQPRLPETLAWVRLCNLRVGTGRLNLLLRRQGLDVAANVVEREGDAQLRVIH